MKATGSEQQQKGIAMKRKRCVRIQVYRYTEIWDATAFSTLKGNWIETKLKKRRKSCLVDNEITFARFNRHNLNGKERGKLQDNAHRASMSTAEENKTKCITYIGILGVLWVQYRWAISCTYSIMMSINAEREGAIS